MVNAAPRNGKHSRSQQVDFSMAFRTSLAILLPSFNPWLQATNSSDLHSLTSEAEDGHQLTYSTAHFTQSSNMKLIPRHGSEHVRTTHKQNVTARDQFFLLKGHAGKECKLHKIYLYTLIFSFIITLQILISPIVSTEMDTRISNDPRDL
jgi:hypothetical protein